MRNQVSHMRGSVLIMVLWALSLLAVFAVQISAMTQNKITFLARAERINVLRNGAKSAIYKALGVIRNEPFNNKTKNPLFRALTLYNNPASFRDLSFGQAQVSVFYNSADDSSKMYGVTDETRRLNINTADRDSIRRLLMALGIVTEDEADIISAGIFDWRENGESELKGFSSDNFYDNLEFPYPQKKDKYETLDELKLVEGVSEKIYSALKDYVTIYGDEQINMNTVSWPVLMALGFSEEEAKTVVSIRRGADGLENSVDDFFFEDSSMLVENAIAALTLEPPEADKFRQLVNSIPFVVDSKIFRVESQAMFLSRKENTSITCVFDTTDDKIIYWRQY